MRKWFLIILLIILAAGASAGYVFLKKPNTPKQSTTTASKTSSAATSTTTTEPEPQLDTSEIHTLINQERTNAKLHTLAYSDDLYDSALAKCEDMKRNNYFTHDSPAGVSYTTFIKKVAPAAKLTGENLGAGYTDNATLIKEWMDSPKHKENIMNAKFNTIGIAVCGKASEKPGLIIVAHFIQS